MVLAFEEELAAETEDPELVVADEPHPAIMDAAAVTAIRLANTFFVFIRFPPPVNLFTLCEKNNLFAGYTMLSIV